MVPGNGLRQAFSIWHWPLANATRPWCLPTTAFNSNPTYPVSLSTESGPIFPLKNVKQCFDLKKEDPFHNGTLKNVKQCFDLKKEDPFHNGIMPCQLGQQVLKYWCHYWLSIGAIVKIFTWCRVFFIKSSWGGLGQASVIKPGYAAKGSLILIALLEALHKPVFSSQTIIHCQDVTGHLDMLQNSHPHSA
jgi:hypothetical protein